MKNKVILKKAAFLCTFFIFSMMPISINAQVNEGNKANYQDVSFDVTVKDVNLLISGDTRIFLWGIEKINPNASILNLKARKELEKKIGDDLVLCTIKRQSKNSISAQCINRDEEDLSLFLLQQGYVSADRTAINNTIYENPYLNAEQNAQDGNKGAWMPNVGGEPSVTRDRGKSFMFGAFIIVAVFIITLIVLGFYVMRGFGRVVDVQNRSLDLAMKEQSLKEREKTVLASMISSEVTENKTKIEAYLMVYEEMLKELMDTNVPPKYQKTGEIIQRQPALSRAVFDGNTGKLNLLGSELSSKVIHYYARIKSNLEYIEISPNTPLHEFRETLNSIIENARKLGKISDGLLEMSDNPEYLKSIHYNQCVI